jgi:hypothetical protein
MWARSQLFLALAFYFDVHCSGFNDASGGICALQINSTHRPCKEGFCLPLTVAAMSILSLPLSLSLKQINLRVCLYIDVIGLAVVLKEMRIIFASSGS